MSSNTYGLNISSQPSNGYVVQYGLISMNAMFSNASDFQQTLASEQGNTRPQNNQTQNQSRYRDDLGLSEISLAMNGSGIKQASLNNMLDAQGIDRLISNNMLAPNMPSPRGGNNVRDSNQAQAIRNGNVTGAQQTQQTQQQGRGGAGYQLLDEALKAGVITFDKGDERVLYDYLGEALTKSPTMMRDFIGDLNKGNTYSFGYRNSGQPSFATLNTNKNRIEFNSQDLYQRAPYGPNEVAYHELYHSIYDVDHGGAHNNYIAKAIQEAGLQRVR